MNASRHQHSRNVAVVPPRAFTLLEILLAVAIFSIVLLAIHGVFYGALRLRNKTTKAIEAALPLQQTLAIMQRDLANLVLPGGTLFGGLQTSPTSSTSTNTTTTSTSFSQLGQTAPGEGAISLGQASPEFYTASGIIDDYQPWGEVEKVYYYLAEPTNNTFGMDLYRSVTRNLLPTLQEQSEDQWLLGGVQSIFFQFYDGTQWMETWDSSAETNNLPQAIKVQIQLASDNPGSAVPQLVDPIELVVPMVVQQSTNQTDQTSGGQP